MTQSRKEVSLATEGTTSGARIVDSRAARLACRAGQVTGTTAGLAPGYVQGNLVILPREDAADFMRFAQANPKPCPIIGVGEAGDPTLPALGEDLDIRTDLPGYRVWRDGECVAETGDVSGYWRDDLVSFVIGCSYSFEEALVEDGIEIRHIVENKKVPMFRTSIPTQAAGRFHGPLVVSMRPLKPADAIRAVQITSRYPAVHGAPVHIGLPEQIGISDIHRPDYGDSVEVRANELPVFWACGVTPQAALVASKPGFAITHSPGSMLVTDLKNRQYAVI